MSPAPQASTPMREAIDRFARLRAHEASPAEMAELEAWLDDAPENREAFERLDSRWSVMDSLRGETSMLFMREKVRREVKALRARRVVQRSLAASLAAAVLVGGAFAPTAYSHYAEQRARAHATTFRTGVGQLTTVRLDDGTLATLDTNTVVRNWQVKHARYVELVQGRARFQVVKDPARPFSVLADGKSVTALGTDFDVYLRPRGLLVTLAEGRLRVKGEEHGKTVPSVDMTAGYQLTTNRTGWALAHADARADMSWTAHQLTFRESTLAEIAEELNRYSSHRIVVDDPVVRQKRMSAIIGTTDTRTFLDAVTELSLAQVRQVGDTYELLRP